MELELTSFLIVCPLVFIGGIMDSISGGGGLIAFPAYVLAGVPMHYTIGTTKLSSVPGNLLAAIRFYRRGYIDLYLAIPAIVAALVGAAIGSLISVSVSEHLLENLMIIVLPIAAYYIFKTKNFDTPIQTISRDRSIAYIVIVSFILGIYDGFYGPGGATILILLYYKFVKIDILHATGNAKIVNLSSNIAALTVFFIKGTVFIPLGLCAGIFGLLGGYVGSELVIRNGGKIIRPLMMTVLVILFIKIIYNVTFGG